MNKGFTPIPDFYCSFQGNKLFVLLQGCVNAVGFSSSGSILVSGSDDLQIALWDWNREKMLMAFPSGHRNNVFQVSSRNNVF
jgi:WD40 repeat protein